MKLKFIEAYNVTVKEKKQIVKDRKAVIDLLTDTTKLDEQIESVTSDLIMMTERINRLIKEYSKSGLSSNDYGKKYQDLMAQYEVLKQKQEALITEKDMKQSKDLNLKVFVKNMTKTKDKLSEWDEQIWMLMVESGTVHRNKNITFKFNNGLNFKAKE